MENLFLPTTDQPVVLISRGTTLIVERDHSEIEEYSMTAIPGTKKTSWEKADVENKISDLLAKGWSYQ